jgi:hypothetical protein
MFSSYDHWKTTDPSDREPHFGKCPVCKARHWEHENCDEAEPIEPDDREWRPEDNID